MSKKRDRAVSVALIAGGITFIGIRALKYFASRNKSIISDISWICKDENSFDLSWYDEDDVEQIYTIFISIQRGININDPKTYFEKIQVTSLTHINGHFTHNIKVSNEWNYFIIAKESYVSSEFEVHVKWRPEFNIKNLQPRILVRENDFGYTVIKLKAIVGVEKYRFYHYFGPDEVEEKDYELKDGKFVQIRFRATENSVGYIAPVISGKEEFSHFLFVSEKVYEGNKWRATILIS